MRSKSHWDARFEAAHKLDTLLSGYVEVGKPLVSFDEATRVEFPIFKEHGDVRRLRSTLEEDGYVRYIAVTRSVEVTVSGEEFCRRGGYVADVRYERRSERIRVITFVAVIASLLVSIAGLLVSLLLP